MLVTAVGDLPYKVGLPVHIDYIFVAKALSQVSQVVQ